MAYAQVVSSKVSALSLLALAGLLTGCSSNSSKPNPVPILTTISPTSAAAGSDGFTLTVGGSSFLAKSVVNWNGSPRATTYVSPTRITAAIPATDIAAAGPANVVVTNPPPGGGSSGAGSFTITPPNLPVPAISSLSPAGATAGGTAFSLTVNGSNFVSASTVNWNGSARTTTWVSATQLAAAIPATDIQAAATAQVTVTNPTPGGGTSPAVAFNVNPQPNPVPTVTTISPSSTIAGSGAFTLTVNGTRFVSAAVVLWNGAAQATSFLNSTQVTAQIPAANVAAAGTVTVAVQNPAPGGGTSNAASFAINPAGPTIGIVETITQPISGTSPNASQFSPTINSDGQFVEFVSNSTNLTATDTNGTTTDIFRRTTCVGASAPAPCTPSTEIVSLTSTGAQGGVSSVGATVTGPGRYSSNDGRFTVFAGSVRDYANPPIQSNTQTVVLRDTCANVASGCTPSTSIQSLTDANAIASAMGGTLSGGGRVVVFRSGADNVVSGVLRGNVEFPVYARDTCFGAPASPACVPTTRLVSVSTAGALPAASPGNVAFVQGESISDDGRYVAFASNALNLAPSDTQNEYNVYLRDTCIGAAASCTTQTILVSENKNGGIPVAAPTGSEMPSMSSNGRYVLFWSDATDLVAKTTSGLEYYLRDTCLGVASGCTPATTLLTVDSNGNPLTLTSLLTTTQLISSNGRLVVFGPVPPIHPGDPADAIYALDTCAGAPAGCTPSSKVISVDGQGKPVPSLIASAISKDGHYAALADSSNFNIYLALTGY